jgi:serine/threonine-protein kinase RsbW
MFEAPVKVEASIPSDVRLLAYVSRLAQETVRMLVDESRAEALCATVDVCLTEAITNAIQHAHRSDAARPLRLCIEADKGMLTMRVFDTGPGFDLTRIPEPDFDELREHGRGLFIIRSSMDSVSYKPADGGNVLEMQKRLS